MVVAFDLTDLAAIKEGREPLCIAQNAELQPIANDFAHNAASN